MSEKNDKQNASSSPQSQQWSPESYQKNAAFVAELGLPLLDLLRPVPGERILDLGCGDGVLTEKLAKICEVVGVDASPEQVQGAQALGLNAQVMSGEALTFDQEFDAVFSNAALHWMLNPDSVIRGVRRALKPQGRFVAEFGGFGNVAAIREALERELDRRGIDGAGLSPWYFPAPDEYRGRLEAEGFAVDDMELFDRPTPLPGDVTGWLQTFGESYLAVVPDEERDDFLTAVREALRPVICGEDGVWMADYVRLRFAARLQA